MIIIMEDDKVLYTEKQFQQKIDSIFYKYFPDGECWVRTSGSHGRYSKDIVVFAKQDDNNDFMDNIDVLNIYLYVHTDTVSTLTFPLTEFKTIKIDAISSKMKLPEDSNDKYIEIPFKPTYGNADKILNYLDRYLKNVRQMYDKFYFD